MTKHTLFYKDKELFKLTHLFKRKLVDLAMSNLSHNNAVLEQAKGYKKYQWDFVLYLYICETNMARRKRLEKNDWETFS